MRRQVYQIIGVIALTVLLFLFGDKIPGTQHAQTQAQECPKCVCATDTPGPTCELEDTSQTRTIGSAILGIAEESDRYKIRCASWPYATALSREKPELFIEYNKARGIPLCWMTQPATSNHVIGLHLEFRDEAQLKEWLSGKTF